MSVFRNFKRRLKNLIHRKIQGFIFDFMQYNNVKYKTSDIFIVEFPKSGITFLSFLLSNILDRVNKLSIQPTYYNIDQFVIDAHQTNGLTLNSVLNPRLIKSHYPYKATYKQIIYLIRNPVDVLVSYFNYTNDIKVVYFDSFSTFIRHDRRGIKAWINHTENWLNRMMYHQKMYVIKYEDLIHNPEETLKNLGTMLGYELSNDIVLESIQASSMENMIKSETLYRDNNPSYNMVFIGNAVKVFKKADITPEDYQYIMDIVKKSEIYKKYYGE